MMRIEWGGYVGICMGWITGFFHEMHGFGALGRLVHMRWRWVGHDGARC